jgi:hypothetical protein
MDHYNPEILAVLLSSFSGFLLGKVYQISKQPQTHDDSQAITSSVDELAKLDKLVIAGKFERTFKVVREDPETHVLYVEHLLEKKQYRLLKVEFMHYVQKNDIFQLVTSSKSMPLYVTSWLERDAADGDLVLFIQYE